MKQPNAVDHKLDFYLQHHALIEEWASLRHHAVERLVAALLDHLARLNDRESDAPTPDVVKRGKETLIQMDLREDVYVELYLDTSKLFRPSTNGHWPTLAIVAHPQLDKNIRAQLSTATSDYARSHGFVDTGHKWWLWHRSMRPASLPFDVDEYAHSSVNTFLDAWKSTSTQLNS